MPIEFAKYLDGSSKIMFLALSMAGLVMFCIFTGWSAQNKGILSKTTLLLAIATAAWPAAGLWNYFS